jgi:hypothetical protein
VNEQERATEGFRVLNKVAKWRRFFASWQLGTRLETDGEFKAVSHNREMYIMLRIEQNALVTLLVKKGTFTAEEYQDQVIAAAKALDHAYEESYPGFRSTENGMSMKMPEALETMQNMGFPA